MSTLREKDNKWLTMYEAMYLRGMSMISENEEEKYRLLIRSLEYHFQLLVASKLDSPERIALRKLISEGLDIAETLKAKLYSE